MRRRLGLGAVAGAGDASVRDVSMDIQGETHGDFPQEWTMTDPDLVQSSSQENQDSTTTNTVTSPTKTSQPPFSNRGRLGWAIVRVTIPPVLFLTAGIVLLATLGAMQRFGWISMVGDGSGRGDGQSQVAAVDYICPMMCTPPQQEPGRCPVCAMELVPASGGGAGGDDRSVVVDAATRRVANIKTASVRRRSMLRRVRAVGELQYDEARLKTIAAYTKGRFDRLFVNYTGAVVQQGERLATFYSPDLFSAQVEYLEAAVASGRPTTISAIAQANEALQRSARQKLIEFGLTDPQIEQLVQRGSAQSRLDIVAPMTGTVIEKLVVEGEYVQEGEPVFRLADLSKVWLVLDLFPSDAAAVRYGQSVEARIKSLPGQTFRGRIAFIDPDVNSATRTVRTRVVLDNDDGALRVGDYATAKIEVPVVTENGVTIYDSELAGKWISPCHPEVISDQPGDCHLCNKPLVPTASLGFSDGQDDHGLRLVVPRSAVLSAADQNLVYVETETGRFQIRRVMVGATSGDDVVVLQGLSEGEMVAVSGNFLLDSQMQLAGNPSLIDPARAAPPTDLVNGFDAEMMAEINQLPEVDRELAIQQRVCPVTDYQLGSMGVPPKLMIGETPVFLCCEGCRESLLEEPVVYLAKLRSGHGTQVVPSATMDSAFSTPQIGPMLPIVRPPGLPEIGPIEILAPTQGESQ